MSEIELTKKEVIIATDYEGFEEAFVEFKAKQSVEQRLIEAVNFVLGVKVAKLDFAVASDFTNEQILNKYKTKNTLNLALDKLKFVLSIDTSEIENLQKEWLQLQNITEPNIKDFQTKAETPEEIYRYETAQELINGFAKFNSIQHIYYGQILQAIQGVFIYNHSENKLEVNSNFVKNISLRG